MDLFLDSQICSIVYVYVFMPILHNDYWSFVVSFEIVKCESYKFALLFQGCFGYSEYSNEFFTSLIELLTPEFPLVLFYNFSLLRFSI